MQLSPYSIVSDVEAGTQFYQKTFFGAIHGQVTDRYGTNWLMNHFE